MTPKQEQKLLKDVATLKKHVVCLALAGYIIALILLHDF